MEKKKGFANTHYPGIKADPNEGMAGIPKEAQEFFKERVDRIGAEKMKKIWETPVLLLGVGKSAQPLAEKLMHAGIRRVGVLCLESSDEARASMRALGSGLRSKYPWIEFEPFGGLSLDRDVGGILRGFRIAVDCSEGGFKPEIVQEAKRMGLKFCSASELAALPEESLSDRLVSESKSV